MDMKGFTAQWLTNTLIKELGDAGAVRKVVLDIGCIGSVYAPRLPKHVGIDIRQDYVSPNVIFKRADARCLDLPDKSVDHVILAETLEYVGQICPGYGTTVVDPSGPALVLNEVLRVLKLKGTLWLSTPVGALARCVVPAGKVGIIPMSMLREMLDARFRVDFFYPLYWKEGRFRNLRPDDPIDDAGHLFYSPQAFVAARCVAVGRIAPAIEPLDFPRPEDSLDDDEKWAKQLADAARLGQPEESVAEPEESVAQ